jgi:hypothetical protein
MNIIEAAKALVMGATIEDEFGIEHKFFPDGEVRCRLSGRHEFNELTIFRLCDLLSEKWTVVDE